MLFYMLVCLEACLVEPYHCHVHTLSRHVCRPPRLSPWPAPWPPALADPQPRGLPRLLRPPAPATRLAWEKRLFCTCAVTAWGSSGEPLPQDGLNPHLRCWCLVLLDSPFLCQQRLWALLWLQVMAKPALGAPPGLLTPLLCWLCRGYFSNISS